MVVIGEQTHPQVLFTGFKDADPAFAAMSALVPTARLLADGGMNDLRDVEWDIVVSRGTDVDAPNHMHVLALGCERVGLAKTDRGGSIVFYGGKQPSEILHVADDLPDALRRLVVGELVPWLQAQPIRPFLMTSTGSGLYGKSVGFGRPIESSTSPAQRPQRLVAFVRDADGNMIAGAFERYGSGWCWTLPYVPENPELWLAAALSDWHERTPGRVPALPGWRVRASWATRRETTLRADLVVLRGERQRLLADLDVRETALRSAEMAAIAAADGGPRRLLTAQGDKLVDAVTDAFETLGYAVTNVDNEEAGATGQPKVEDLRLSDPDEPGRTNITEVRGYKGGAKISDFQRLARFAAVYLRRTGALPTTRWYVVNQFLGTDPDTRRRPLAGSEDDLSVFAEDGGLVIDTRDLFHLARRVDDGGMSTAAARALLRRSAGVLQMSLGTSDET
jgi:hypothetical protein